MVRKEQLEKIVETCVHPEKLKVHEGLRKTYFYCQEYSCPEQCCKKILHINGSYINVRVRAVYEKSRSKIKN